MVIIPVRSEEDVFKARRCGREMARELGFPSHQYTAVEIVVSELATNIVRHAPPGMIRIETIEDGLEIISEDQGKGIADLKAVLNGKTRKPQGLGIGLAGVKRLMDEVKIDSVRGRGTRIVARLWKNKPPRLLRPLQDYQVPCHGRLEYGVVSTPCQGGDFNGDAYVIREFGKKILLAVIDGLGHGQPAYHAAQRAAGQVQKSYHHSLPQIIGNCHQELRHSRGAVLGLALLDLGRANYACAGIGNIVIQAVGSKPFRYISSPGIIGHGAAEARVAEFPYEKGDMLILYSDGISHFDPHDFATAGRELQQVARQIVGRYGRDNDDATIVLARES